MNLIQELSVEDLNSIGNTNAYDARHEFLVKICKRAGPTQDMMIILIKQLYDEGSVDVHIYARGYDFLQHRDHF
jgi:hypothetical protein